MPNTVLKLKRSLISGITPDAGSLALGEVAINIADRKVWVGTGGEIAPAILISDYYGGGVSFTEGSGINITTNNQIQLDLSNGVPTTTSADKYDKLLMLDISSGGSPLGTKLVSTLNFLNYGLSTSLSTDAWDGTPTNDQRTTIAVQDANPNAFSIKTLQNASGSKLNIFKIDTDVVGGARTNIGGTELRLEPTDDIVIGTAPLTINSYSINMANVTSMTFGYNSSVSGIGSLTPSVDTGNTLGIQGNLLVTGYIETYSALGAQFSERITDLFASTLVAGNNINIDFDDTNNAISISTLGSVWDRTDATLATDIFGIPAGTIISAGTDAITVLERILYPFQPATISTFTMSGSTTVELGQNVSSPSFTWVIGNLTNADTATLGWSGLLSGSSLFVPASNQTAYNPAIGTSNSTTAGASLSFTLTVTQDDNAYANVSSTRTITWRPKIYVGRSTQSDYTNITNVTDITSGTSYFVSGTSPATPSGGTTVSSGSGFIYILVHSSINDLSTLSIDQTPGQLSAFSKVSSSHTINNGYANSSYKVYKSVNELTGSIRLDFT